MTRERAIAEAVRQNPQIAAARKERDDAHARASTAEERATGAHARAEEAEQLARAADTMAKAMAKDVAEALVEAAREAAEKRLRPCLMTTLVATVGLLPAAVSNGIGAQTQKPLAIVVIGGALILAVLPRLFQPAMLLLAHRRDARFRAADGAPRQPRA